jgi:hypothetical protein
MGFLRNLLYGGLTLATLSSFTPDAKADPLDMRPKKEIKINKSKSKIPKYNPKFELPKKLKHPAFDVPKSKKEESFSSKPALSFLGSSSGSFTQLDYYVPSGIELGTDGKLWYKDLNFDIQNENFFDKLQFYISRNLMLPTTPLDRAAFDILKIRELRNQYAGPLKVTDWYNVFRLFYDKVNPTWDGKTFTAKGDLRGFSNTFVELFGSHNFRIGKDLIRYEHGIRYHVLAKARMFIDAQFTYGDGLNLGIHELEKYFGSTFNMRFFYKIMTDLTAAETHQFSIATKHGWQGIGLDYQEFYRSFNYQGSTLRASATLAEVEKLKLVDIKMNNQGQEKTEFGKSYLLYGFRSEFYKHFWYYMMGGIQYKEGTRNLRNITTLEDITINLFGGFERTPTKFKIASKGDIKEHRFAYALLGGLNINDHLYPYLGVSNYPFDKQLVGAIISAPRFLADLSIENNNFFGNSPFVSMEFFVPILFKGDYKKPLMNFMQERTTQKISPFSTQFTLMENSRRKAYSNLEGLFLTGELNNDSAMLGFLLNNGNKTYLELGFRVNYIGDGINIFTRFGFNRIGFLLSYAGRFNKKLDIEGHKATLGIVGDINNYFLKIDANIWFDRNSGYQHTLLGYIKPQNEKYFMVSFGGTF